ncbi:uncharacterized protein BHQ10_009468 [Talaromyces amestolkiae]|uniref:Major facilitator superfamily (MFS) profile domain-containing protein n=1 Tax=Talaromyces amestolkiae TaxID=1196081 RepID=A0A364LCB8_TALAM|nr:uncharacterized protein BHQ10_009468 [Talaromyces amestolkiae]RAO73456.1 hypothetical protein BHQ10_009468 [Talaromyces amestolkiae]
MRLSSSCSTCRSRKKKCVALASGNICALCMAKTLQCDLKARRKSASSRRQLALQSAEQEVSTDRQTANKCDILQHSVCDELIELYFDMIHNKQLILFHRRTFLEQRRSGSLPTYLLLGALAVVARFSTNPYFNGIEPTARARPLLHRALKSFNDRQIPISVHSLQAAILLAFTCFVEGERDEEALLSAQAVRMVQLLDLPHRSPAGTVEHEIEIRLFWHALMMDVWHSACERLPRQLIAKPTIPLPLEEEQFENMSPTEERQVVGILMDTDRNSGIMTNVTRLSETYAEIMQLNDMLVHDPSFDFLRDHKVIHLTYQLDEWLRTLPKHLHNTPENLQAFAARNPAVLVGRITMGYGGDLNGLVLGYYVTEVAPKSVRGRSLILVQQFASTFIAIAGYWIAYAISYLPQNKSYSWKVAQSLQFAPALVFFILVFRLPESPRWLAGKYLNDDVPLLNSLSYIRSRPMDHPEVLNEAKEIRDYQIWASENESTSILNIFKEKRLARRIGYAMVPLLQQQLCGVGVLTIYAAVIYEQLGLSTQHHALLLNACTQILYAGAALGSSYFVERLGRRTCILSASMIQTLGLVCISGLALGTAGSNSTNTVANGFIATFIILNNMIYWLLGTGPAVVYVNEIMPTQCRELGVGIANSIPIGVAVALGQQWPNATAAIGAKSYLILLGTCAFGTILVYFFVKEPKGLSIERIDALFGENDHVDEIQQMQQAIKADHDLEVTGKREAHNHVKRDEDACVQEMLVWDWARQLEAFAPGFLDLKAQGREANFDLANLGNPEPETEVKPVGKLRTIEQEVGMIYEPEQPIAMTSINTNSVSEDERVGGDAQLDCAETANV